MVEIDKSWYVAIIKHFDHYSIFVGAYGEQYKNVNFKELAVKNDMQIVAEQFGIRDVEISILEGFTKYGNLRGRNYLNELRQEIESGVVLNPQKALEDLVSFVKRKS